MKRLLSLFSVFTSLTAFGQTVLEIRVQDVSSKDPLSYVSVNLKTGKTGNTQDSLTDSYGKTFFTAAKGDSLYISVSSNVYSSAKKFLIVPARDTVRLTFELALQKVTNLDNFVVRPIGLPVKVFSSERVSVEDFDFLEDGRMVLLTYPKTKTKGTELCVYDGKRVVSELLLKEPGNEIVRDFRGNPHVLTQNKAFVISAKDALINIGEMDREYFLKYLAPLVDSTITKYFFHNFNPDYPAFEYYSFAGEDTNYTRIASIRDDLMMELYRSEYKWVDVRTKLWAKEMENKTGIDAEIWVGANYFTQSIYYKQLYAPLFERNDSLFLFDHYKNLMIRFDDEGNRIDSFPIYHHLQPRQTGWKKQLIQDQVTGEVYSVYETAGWTKLQRIDLNTGEGKETIPVHYRYGEKFLVRKNTLYYTYRPFESAQKKFLYQEALPVGHPATQLQEIESGKVISVKAKTE